MSATSDIKSKFAKLGVRCVIRPQKRLERIPWEWHKYVPQHQIRELRSVPDRFSIDIASDKQGSYFDIRVNRDALSDLEFTVADVQVKDRHLLLFVRDGDQLGKFLCGHDERHWFVAAVPSKGGSSNVAQAKHALKPDAAIDSQSQHRVKAKKRHARKNDGYRRQGEWFFIPCPDLAVPDSQILHHEPISRGRGSKPHYVQYLYRRGGTTVYVCQQYPTGLTSDAYSRLIKRNPEAKKLPWQRMQRDPEAYAKGKISHPDHRTITLHVWHRIVMNDEAKAPSTAAAQVAFLD